ncbi:DUF4258 domain-containing protein [Methanoculleus frigidifontis]|uniref:DUF4258 domain-containing protein n=1 Tax=Methanoculleus frigidifontis TaxID=2584085 RepID=UPI00265A6BF8|nr:DUF4258 domain-containing protein [Methanoculleus sp. FWC-SCC1]
MPANKNRIVELAGQDAVLISRHARVRMFERNIRTDEIIAVIMAGTIIEDYHDDEPCPSVMIPGFIGDQAYQ